MNAEIKVDDLICSVEFYKAGEVNNIIATEEVRPLSNSF
jgi:hypothetical protein